MWWSEGSDRGHVARTARVAMPTATTLLAEARLETWSRSLAPEDGVVLFTLPHPPSAWISTGFSSASALVWSRSMCRLFGLCVVVLRRCALSSSQM